MPYAHGYHHEKDGVGLTAEDDFLLSLCFCPSLAEIRIPSALNDSIMHAQNRSCVGGKADADQDPSRVLCAAGPNPGHPSSPELSFTPCRLRGGWEVKPSQRRSWQSVAVGPTGTALCKPTN